LDSGISQEVLRREYGRRSAFSFCMHATITVGWGGEDAFAIALLQTRIT
jgi:hypothetical protein